MDQQQDEQQRAGRFPNNDVLDHQLQQDSDTTGTGSASSNNSNNGSASGSSSSAVVVEDEPPSDFYASLCGLSGSQRKRKRTLLATPTGPDRSESSGRSSSSAAVACMGTDRSVCIPPDEETGATASGGRSDMARALHKAFTDPPRLSSISLDKRNRGHAMLRRMGWSEDGGGLGKNRQGGMAPVKTELKLDRKGLGASAGRKKTKARVTHKHEHIAAAGGCAVSAVQGSDGTACSESKSERKRRLKAEKERAARKDKRVRMMLSYDVPPEHEELYMKLH